jgi:hypothetical protein
VEETLQNYGEMIIRDLFNVNSEMEAAAAHSEDIDMPY